MVLGIFLVTFLAAAVEWVEAMTIVLAVGTVKGWRSAVAGGISAMLVLIVMVVVFGVAITTYVPIGAFKVIIGAFLLLFGLKWLHKAILRSAGLKAMHDEAKAFSSYRLAACAINRSPSLPSSTASSLPSGSR